MEKQQKNINGISLIVLIIIVIVMVILASAIILLVNDGSIVKKANKALNDSDMSMAKEILVMAKTDWRTNDIQIAKEGYTEFKTYAESRLQEYGFVIGNNAGQVEVSDNGILYEYKTPVIPTGFVASSVKTEDDVSDGLVIYQGVVPVTESNVDVAKETRNQFVWIPVPNINEFTYKEGYKEGVQQKYIALGEISEPCLTTALSITMANDITGEYAEYEKMKESIEKYGGFYIGRYETGTSVDRTSTTNSTSADILIQKNKPVYNFVGWAPNMELVTGEVFDNSSEKLNRGVGAVQLSRNMNLNTTEVANHLIYSIEWDAIMNFINDEVSIKDSRMYGNYKDYNDIVDGSKQIDGAGTIQNTGYSEYWKVKNIYDIAGNVSEWTMEAYHGPIIGRIHRGGTAADSGYSKPVSIREGKTTNSCDTTLGFRIAMFLK